jgi:hypothetical protein
MEDQLPGTPGHKLLAATIRALVLRDVANPGQMMQLPRQESRPEEEWRIPQICVKNAPAGAEIKSARSA